MDTKDWLAVGSLVVSTVALLASVYSVLLARSRDRRDVETKRPRIDIEMPAFEGRGPWFVKYTLTNRSSDPVTLDAVGLYRFRDGDFMMMSSTRYRLMHRWRFWPYAQAVREIGQNVLPEKCCTGTIEIASRDGKQLRDPVPVTFYVEATARDSAETAYRWRINRIATPDKMTAAT